MKKITVSHSVGQVKPDTVTLQWFMICVMKVGFVSLDKYNSWFTLDLEVYQFYWWYLVFLGLVMLWSNLFFGNSSKMFSGKTTFFQRWKFLKSYLKKNVNCLTYAWLFEVQSNVQLSGRPISLDMLLKYHPAGASLTSVYKRQSQ